MNYLEQQNEVRNLSLDEMEETVGGILCSQVQNVINELMATNWDAYVDFIDTWGSTTDGQTVGHGPNTLQCTEL